MFWHSEPSIRNHDLQLTFAWLAIKKVQSKLIQSRDLPVQPGNSALNRSGYIHARSADPYDRPVIQPNYLDAEEERVVLAGMKLARQLMHSAALRLFWIMKFTPARIFSLMTSCFRLLVNAGQQHII